MTRSLAFSFRQRLMLLNLLVITACCQPAPALGEESIESGEVELIESIRQQTLDRLAVQYPAGKGTVLRDAHPKTHGLVQAQFIVGDGIPAPLRYGVFAKPATLNAVVRFSAGGVDAERSSNRNRMR